MPKANRVHSTPPTSTSPTRRNILGTIAAAAAAATTIAARPAAAGPIAADPIYAAIERHQAAAVVWDAAVDVWAKFPDGPEPTSMERRIERERINDAWRAARDAMDDTGIDLINTSPTTLGGIARALNYIAASRDLSDEEIKPVLKLKHHEIVELTKRHGVNVEWLLKGKGRVFEKDPIRLGPNSTGAEFAAVVAMMPEAKQRTIEAAVDQLLKERDL